MFDPIEDQGEAKDYSKGYMSHCQMFSVLQQGHAEVNSAEVSITTTIYPLRHKDSRTKAKM